MLKQLSDENGGKQREGAAQMEGDRFWTKVNEEGVLGLLVTMRGKNGMTM